MKANKTRWTEKWLVGGAVQLVSLRIVEDANYNESTAVVLQPIKVEEPSVKVNRVAMLAQQLKRQYGV